MRFMFRNMIANISLMILLALGHRGIAGPGTNGSVQCENKQEQTACIDSILEQLTKTTSQLKSYHSKVEYLFSQPLFESETLRKGVLYYDKNGAKSYLRLDFRTLRQDQDPEQKYIEHYIFDGTWLTHIDYEVKSVKLRQLAEVNEPLDAFELAGRVFPVVGFRQTEDLKKQFEISLIAETPEKKDYIGLLLKTRADSIYKEDYKFIELWIDKKSYLPGQLQAVSVENDIYRFKLLAAEVNKGIDKKIFEVRIPEGFDKPEIIPLK